jgi:tetratricopeptide (TPR) repeat protein
MKKFFTYSALFFSLLVFAQNGQFTAGSYSQNEQLGQNYFDRGDFDKAVLIYEDLVKAQPNNYIFIQKQLACYQQLKQYEKAQTVIQNRLNRTQQANLYVDLGYNYQLQKNTDKANKNYKIALDKIKENPNNVYAVAQSFEQKVLIKEAIEAYTLGSSGNPNANFDYQIALLQGQLGNMEVMTDKLLDYAFNFPVNLNLVQNQLSRFIAENAQESFIDYLKKSLLLRTQKTQDIFWNQFMSWFFVQQKEYGKAFIQEKAIFKRNPENFGNIVNLGKITIEEKEFEIARNILDFILLNTQDTEILLEAQYQLVSLDIEKATPKDFPTIQLRFNQLLTQFGITTYSLHLQTLKAHFDAFYLQQFELAKATLDKALELSLNNYQKAEVKMELADVLLLNQKFNQAIIYYAQIEDDLRNDEIAHEASFKMAKASYFKCDFEWAQQQFKVLKSSTSQLIANDAMQLFLLINDNTVEDSTQVALKKFAKADFFLYQNKNAEALTAFKLILIEHKGQSIEDEVLLRIGQLYEKQGDFQEALNNFQEIINKHDQGIYIDEALFFSAEIYRKQLQNIDKAKLLYEKIIFSHEDSIYFVEARNNYRKLRGDTNI